MTTTDLAQKTDAELRALRRATKDALFVHHYSVAHTHNETCEPLVNLLSDVSTELRRRAPALPRRYDGANEPAGTLDPRFQR